MTYKGRRGPQYTLSAQSFAKGAEGEIFDIAGQSGLVAKIYHPGKATSDKEHKLAKMLNDPPDKNVLAQIAWPQDVLYDSRGQFVGFVMRKMSVNEELNVMYESGASAKYPKMPWSSRIIIAKNLCIVLHSVHKSGHVCGDLNPRNINVDPRNGLVTFLDTDSYHIQDGAKTYRCDMGFPQYLPVEIQKKMRGGVNLVTAPLPTFSQDTDNFALAIHIFQLLMNGTHPFTCAIIPSHVSVTAPQPVDNIEKGLFPFVQKHSGIKIPVFAPPISILPAPLQSLFKRAFIDGHTTPSARPKPAEWHTALEDLGKNLQTCTKVAHHQYDGGLSSCPWCDIIKVTNNALNIAPLQQIYKKAANNVLNTFPTQQTHTKPAVAAPKPTPSPRLPPSPRPTSGFWVLVIIGLIGLAIWWFSKSDTPTQSASNRWQAAASEGGTVSSPVSSSAGVTPVLRNCVRCDGSGSVACRQCNGRGNTTCQQCGGRGNIQSQQSAACSTCGGTGNKSVNCWQCKGAGYWTQQWQQTCSACSGRRTIGQVGYRGVRIQVPCVACSGNGSKTVTKQNQCGTCRGSGKETFRCNVCAGRGSTMVTGTTTCQTCKGAQKLSCDACRGAAKTSCTACNGTGKR